MSNRGFMALTFLLRMVRLMSTGAMCWSALVLSTTLLWWPAHVQAQGVGEAVALARAAGEIAQAAPNDLTRLALQVAIVSMLVNATLIFAFWKVQLANANKPCIMSGAMGQDILSNWFYRAFKAGTEKAESEKH
jgi:hypothetical protein